MQNQLGVNDILNRISRHKPVHNQSCLLPFTFDQCFATQHTNFYSKSVQIMYSHIYLFSLNIENNHNFLLTRKKDNSLLIHQSVLRDHNSNITLMVNFCFLSHNTFMHQFII